MALQEKQMEKRKARMDTVWGDWWGYRPMGPDGRKQVHHVKPPKYRGSKARQKLHLGDRGKR